MRFLALAALVFSSCSTLMSAGAAAGGAAIGSLAGPGGAAIGAAGGVVAIELLEEEDPVIADNPASAIHETASLIETIGLWYLVLFIFIPFLSSRFRKMSGSSVRAIFGNSAPKKWVEENFDRLNTHEDTLNNLKDKLNT